MKKKKLAIVDLARNGTTSKDNPKMLNKPLSTAYTVTKYLQMTGRVKRKNGSGLKRSVRTPQLIKAVKSQISWSPVWLMRKMAKKLSVSEQTIRNVVKKDLKAKSRAKIKKNLVSPSVKQTPKPPEEEEETNNQPLLR